MFNIDYEKKFIYLLGYTIGEKDNSNRWIIYDENNTPVGFIQYKKLKCKDIKRNIPAKYGYYTVIEKDDLKFTKSRYENNNNSLINDYSFYIENDILCELMLEDINSLTISSKKYGFISFGLDKNSLNFNYKRTTENFNIEEYVQISTLPDCETFIYNLNFTDKNNDVQFGHNNIKSFSISIAKDNLLKEDQLRVRILSFNNNVLKNQEEYIVKGEVKEAIEKLELANISFNYLRSFLKDILPFKEDIIAFMFNNIEISQENLLLLFSQSEEELKRKLAFN